MDDGSVHFAEFDFASREWGRALCGNDSDGIVSQMHERLTCEPCQLGVWYEAEESLIAGAQRVIEARTDRGDYRISPTEMGLATADWTRVMSIAKFEANRAHDQGGSATV